MEAVAYFAGEPHSDKPKCACPVLTQYGITLNDRFSDDERQLLKPFIKKLIGTRDGNSQKRAEFLAHQAGTVFVPLALDSIGLSSHAEALRKIKLGNLSGLSGLNSAARSAASAARWAAADSAAASAAWAASAASAARWAAYSADSAASAASAAASAASAAASAASADTAKQARLKIVKLAIKALDQAIKIK